MVLQGKGKLLGPMPQRKPSTSIYLCVSETDGKHDASLLLKVSISDFFKFQVGLLSDKMLVGLSSLAITLSSESQQDENPGVAGWVLVENSMGTIFVLSLSYNFVGKMGDSSSVLYKGLRAFLSQISSGLKHHPRQTSSSFTVHLFAGVLRALQLHLRLLALEIIWCSV